jgi:hypothetical protein
MEDINKEKKVYWNSTWSLSYFSHLPPIDSRIHTFLTRASG